MNISEKSQSEAKDTWGLKIVLEELVFCRFVLNSHYEQGMFPLRMCQKQRQLRKNWGKHRSREILGLRNNVPNNNMSHKSEESEYVNCRNRFYWVLRMVFWGEKKFSGR